MDLILLFVGIILFTFALSYFNSMLKLKHLEKLDKKHWKYALSVTIPIVLILAILYVVTHFLVEATVSDEITSEQVTFVTFVFAFLLSLAGSSFINVLGRLSLEEIDRKLNDINDLLKNQKKEMEGDLMKEAIIKLNGLYFNGMSESGTPRWVYSKEEALTVEGFETIRETITSIVEDIESVTKEVNIQIVSPDEPSESNGAEYSTTGNTQGANVIY